MLKNVQVTRVTLGVAIMLLLSACTPQHAAKSANDFFAGSGMGAKTRISRTQDWVLNSSSHIYLASPRSHSGLDSQQQAIQQQLTVNLGRNLEQHFAVVKLGHSGLSFEAALKEARNNQSAYLIYPRLLGLKDNMSSVEEIDNEFYDDEKTLGLDRLALQLQIYNALTGEFLDRVNIESKSGWLAIYSNHPSELMHSAFKQASSVLSGQTR